VFRAAQQSPDGRAFGPGYVIVRNNKRDKEIWPEVCGGTNFLYLEIMVMSVVAGSWLNVLYQLCHICSVNLVRKNVENADGCFWDLAGGWHTHLIQHWMFPLVINIQFVLSFILFYVAYPDIVQGLVVAAHLCTMFFGFLETQFDIRQYKTNEDYRGLSRAPLRYWVCLWAFWAPDTVSVALALKTQVYVVELNDYRLLLKLGLNVLKSIQQLQAAKKIIQRRPCCCNTHTHDGSYIPLTNRG